MRPTNPNRSGRQKNVKSYRKRVFIACEGYRTEINYFDALRDNGHELRIDPMIEIVVLNRFSGMSGLSDPVRLVNLLNGYMTFIREGLYTAEFLAGSVLEYAHVPDYEYERIRKEIVVILSDMECKGCNAIMDTEKAISLTHEIMTRNGYESYEMEENAVDFNPDVDEVCVVVDRDRSNTRRRGRYSEFLDECRKNGYMPFVTTPKFELWMLLHFEDVGGIIAEIKMSGNPVDIIDRELKRRGANKKNYDFSTLIFHLDEALKNSKAFTSNLEELDRKSGTNLPLLIDMLRM